MTPPDPASPGLAGRWVWVAGATGRIGSATATAAAALGADIVVHGSRDTEAVATLAKRLRADHGVQTVEVCADITAAGGVARARAAAAVGGVESVVAVINCVTGYTGKPVTATDLDDDRFRRLVDTDLVGAHALVRDLIPLLDPDGARVVLLSSLAGVRGRTGAAHLCAAKAGVNGLVLALAQDLAPLRVLVNAVAPGPVAEPGQPVPGLPPGVAVNSPAEVAAAVLALAGAMTTHTGQVVVVNGNEGRPSR
ncbi:SDR family NAD(P)-dependent oxidoreductase [Actinokineospora enzanensis]|uniref:SDR family NAD(P)-dependent oxidoreductase n=1 Tax=Actinokineospora enzanensis TaxID=155975 RepID=UPI00039BD03D|nr:SDR family oxidoreductase [Actinokineospora enzanensis]